MVAIQLLATEHRREAFDCGDAALNEFLLRLAGQQQRRGFGKTYVALAADGLTVTGFVTVSVGQIATASLSAQSKLPRYPAPILRIGRLAVDARHQGKGIGQDLLVFALRLAVEFSQRVGLYAVALVSVLLIEEIQLVIGWQRVYLCLRIFKQLIERRFLEKSEA